MNRVPATHSLQDEGQSPVQYLLVEGVEFTGCGGQPPLRHCGLSINPAHPVESEFLNHLDAGVQLQTVGRRRRKEVATRFSIGVSITECVGEYGCIDEYRPAHE